MPAVRHGGSGKPLLVDSSDMQASLVALFIFEVVMLFEMAGFLLLLLNDWFEPRWGPRSLKGVLFSSRSLNYQTILLAISFFAFMVALIVSTALAAHKTPQIVVPIFFQGLEIFGKFWNQFAIRFAIIAGWVNAAAAVAVSIASLESYLVCKRRLKDGSQVQIPPTYVSVESVATESPILKETVEIPL
ncbi:hypothetical protein M422DRAFT_776387 [Sphaerobolus stellatus SS14]|nr:hypothetical protein M422DRAFT_776387 [Sphaerobolus stellatus SS14]